MRLCSRHGVFEQPSQNIGRHILRASDLFSKRLRETDTSPVIMCVKCVVSALIDRQCVEDPTPISSALIRTSGQRPDSNPKHPETPC
jgi:hypothetical protein